MPYRYARVSAIYPATVLAAMIGLTSWAIAEKPLSEGFRLLLAERWGVATLADAYFGFLTFYGWVYYKEESPVARALWLAGILGFGNIAMAVFVLKEVRALPAGAGFEQILLRRPRRTALPAAK